MKKKEKKTEYEIYLDEVCGYIVTFMNELNDGNKHVVERTVEQMKKRFALDDAQEAALQITLFNLEMMCNEADENFDMKQMVGLDCNIITNILLKDYRRICDHQLVEVDFDEEDGDMPEEVMEAMKAYGHMLIDWYGSQVGAENVDGTDTDTVLRRFHIYRDNFEAIEILEYFKAQMERYRNSTAADHKIERLIKNTIGYLISINSEK